MSRAGTPAPLVFAINSLEGGGAERVFSTVVERLADARGRFDGAEIHVVLLDGSTRRYEVDPRIRTHILDCGGSTARSILRFGRLMAELRPAVAVSFLTRANVANVLARPVGGHRAVVSERVHTSSHFGRGAKAALSSRIVRTVYPRADAVIAVSQGVSEDLCRNFGVDPRKVTVINNPYDIERIRELGFETPEIALPGAFVCAVGRLTANKNFSMLIEAFAKAETGMSLVILGEGEEREALLALAGSLGLADRVLLPGFVANPYAVLARSRLYASASKAEGFPNAMAEAMALGRAVVATDCPSGPAELLGGTVGDGAAMCEARCGMLVPNGNGVEMARALRLMSGDGVAARFGAEGAARIEDFRVERIVEDYAEFIRGMRA